MKTDLYKSFVDSLNSSVGLLFLQGIYENNKKEEMIVLEKKNLKEIILFDASQI